jgi:hypothetical protein
VKNRAVSIKYRCDRHMRKIRTHKNKENCLCNRKYTIDRLSNMLRPLKYSADEWYRQVCGYLVRPSRLHTHTINNFRQEMLGSRSQGMRTHLRNHFCAVLKVLILGYIMFLNFAITHYEFRGF